MQSSYQRSSSTPAVAPGAVQPERTELQPYGNAAEAETVPRAGSNERRGVGQADAQVLRVLQRAAEVSPLSDIAAFDKRSADVSGHDWYYGHGFVPDLLPVLSREAGSEVLYRQTLWFLYEMTEPDADPTRQRVYDLATGALASVPLGDVEPDQVAIGIRMARKALTSHDRIVDNRSPDGTDPVGPTQREEFARTVSAALGARNTLKFAYGFAIDDRSLAAVRAIRHRIAEDDVQPFLDAYLTAFFVTGAEGRSGLKYDYEEVERHPIETFFGNPPGCDQLPDGRGIIDCKGFTAVSQLLFSELSRGEVNTPDGDRYTYGLTVPNHQMALIRTGREVMVVDNDDVVPLAMSAAELGVLDDLHRRAIENGGELDGRVDLDALPTLSALVDDLYRKYRIEGPRKAGWYTAIDVL